MKIELAQRAHELYMAREALHDKLIWVDDHIQTESVRQEMTELIIKQIKEIEKQIKEL